LANGLPSGRRVLISGMRLNEIWATLVSTAFCLGLFSLAAKADEAKFALDHPFTLVDADDKAITSADFPGTWLVIYFGYTHCSDQCPTALSSMAEALDEIGPAADHVQPLFITVDPERDHGPMLRYFTAAFDKRLIGLTGTQEQIADIAHALGVKYEKVLLDDDNYVVDHSSTLSVIDPSGHGGVTFKLAEPYMIAAQLLELLDQSGTALGAVNNLRAYR
jgi:cytochrome oxidase Cu insertion factor (SCO1/SenC/PrrC family)